MSRGHTNNPFTSFTPSNRIVTVDRSNFRVRTRCARDERHRQVVDMMGNASDASYSNGTLMLNLTESPVYVVSANAPVATANATAPAGYVAM
ncbi:hypothetical protein LMG27174_00310 [Paraburkholderia rhynchosiae]|uniref:Uncharacterized protein n=1 Tax=Paraburkholderia rhynchosiae TaxID=487049 RepID=A0A6J4ZNR3_9BURK|nr:hypothetical protein LMG27174_00310 [Paraburkholderia rhynchosiae]